MKMKPLFLLIAFCCYLQVSGQERFPDGELIPNWFNKDKIIDIHTLGKQYRLTDYGVVSDSTILQTDKIQEIIDLAARNGGGVIVVPEGTYLSGALFFKPGTHLHIQENATLKGSDDINNFPIVETRMEGQNLKYFSALINVEGVNGFTLSGKGTINGNGERYWKSFWLRRNVIPKCTNMDELRPRLIYISHSNDVQLSGVRLINSPFWTTHIYKSNNIKLLDLYIYSPAEPVKAPSTDAIDIDACKNVLVRRCHMSVNDDAIALKGGKGPWADKDPNNGGNYNIIIEDCTFGFCHGVLTCGSESIHNRNIILRRCHIDQAKRLLWLKMRPDTPQQYEHILVEDIKGNARNFIYIAPWTQFYDLKDRKDMPISYSSNITMRNINLECETFFAVQKSSQYKLSDFCFENLAIRAKKDNIDKSAVETFTLSNVIITNK